jgi:hypothetical protein
VPQPPKPEFSRLNTHNGATHRSKCPARTAAQCSAARGHVTSTERGAGHLEELGNAQRAARRGRGLSPPTPTSNHHRGHRGHGHGKSWIKIVLLFGFRPHPGPRAISLGPRPGMAVWPGVLCVVLACL